MSQLKLAVVYFSATGVTEAYARVIHEALLAQGCDARLFDVTAHASRQSALPVAAFDAFVFGFPVYADFAPSVINRWLPTLDGQGKPCAQFFTYGARTTGYAHFHTQQLLEEAGFRVQFSAEFLGRHTFNVAGWRILPDRPDAEDFAVAREYAALAAARLAQPPSRRFALQKPFGYDHMLAAREREQASTERGWTHPVRAADACRMCRRCETECPAQAFDADRGLSDPAACIQCMHCVTICPDQVLEVDERMGAFYPTFLAKWHLTEELMRAKRSKIITEAVQAAF